MRLIVLFEEPPMKLDAAMVNKPQQLKAADINRPESAPDSPTSKKQPRYSGNAFTTSKERHRRYFNMGPNGAAPEQKLSNGETNNSQSKRPIMNNIGSPDREKDEMQELMGVTK